MEWRGATLYDEQGNIIGELEEDGTFVPSKYLLMESPTYQYRVDSFVRMSIVANLIHDGKR